jgi:hypothetical protein
MNAPNVLIKFQKIFQSEGKRCRIEPASDDFPLAQLFVDLPDDKNQRTRSLSITYQEQFFQTILEDQQIVNESKYSSIQFDTILPFEVNPRFSDEVSHLLLYINHAIDFPGFGLSEAEHLVYYRYVLLGQEKALDRALLLGIFGTILLILDLFSELIEMGAQGKMTFNQLLEKIIDSSKSYL